MIKNFSRQKSLNIKIYKHSIDESIARFLKSRDKSSFGSKDKIFF